MFVSELFCLFHHCFSLVFFIVHLLFYSIFLLFFISSLFIFICFPIFLSLNQNGNHSSRTLFMFNISIFVVLLLDGTIITIIYIVSLTFPGIKPGPATDSVCHIQYVDSVAKDQYVMLRSLI